MAEETKANVTETLETTVEQPTIEELQAQLTAAKADALKYKNANDKLSKSEAEMKRQLRAKMTEDEQAAEAKRLSDEERETMKKELNYYKAVGAYKGLDAKQIQPLVDAIAEGDHVAIASIIDAEIKAAVKAAEAKWLGDRPRIQRGTNGSAMTKEQIMAIPDATERVRQIAIHKELFE